MRPGRSYRTPALGAGEHARDRVGHVLERLAPVAPKVCGFLEEAEEDLIAFYHLPSDV